MTDAERRAALAATEEELGLRDYSPRTAKIYLNVCRRYLEYLGDAPLAGTGTEQIREWVAGLRESGVSPTSYDGYLSAVAFMYEAALDMPLNHRRLPRAKKPEPMPVAATPAQFSALLDAEPDPKYRAMIALGYGCGLRVSEAVAVAVRDVDSSAARLAVRSGKGRKDRYTVLPSSVLALLREYWALCRPSSPRGWLFPGAREGSHLSSDALILEFRRAAARAGLGGTGVTFHSLRHGFATSMLAAGCDLVTLKGLMGHASMRTTCGYIHPSTPMAGIACPIDGVLAGRGRA